MSAATRISRDVNKPEILSSQESVEEEIQKPEVESAISRQKRNFSLAVTVTSTFTSYVFITTTLNKSFTIATTAAAALAAVGPGGGGLVWMLARWLLGLLMVQIKSFAFNVKNRYLCCVVVDNLY